MKTGKPPDPFLLALYRSSLRLYPLRLRLLYQDQLLQTARDAHADSNSNLCFWSSLFADLLKSAVKEQLLMIREQVLARPIFFHALVIGLILTLMGGSAAATFQQMLRRGANQPQIQMAASYAAEIASGVNPSRPFPVTTSISSEASSPSPSFTTIRARPPPPTHTSTTPFPPHPREYLIIFAVTTPTPSHGSPNQTSASRP